MASIVTGGLGIGLGAGWISGCSLIYDLKTEQCTATADCVAMGGAFARLACVNNLCQDPVITGCQSNSECIDNQGEGVRPYSCVNRECILLRSSECPTILPQTNDIWLENLRADDKTVILAGTGLINDTAVLDPFLMNYDLALTELSKKVTGIGGRRVVMLGCKATYESTDELDAMMTFLADRVKVPAIIAAMGAEDLQRAFEQKADSANLFFMNPLDSDPTVVALPNAGGRIWNIGPGFDFIARAYAPLLKRTLAYLNPTAPVKVATVTATDIRSLTNMIPTIQADPAQYGLLFNDKPVNDNRPGNYRGFNMDSNPDSSVATQVQGLIAFQPTVIISAAENQFLGRIIPQVEAGWPNPGPPRPFYLLSPYNYNASALVDLISSNPSLAARMAGVNGPAAVDDTNYRTYTGAWDDNFPDSIGLRGYENLYDAAYYLLYSIAAAAQPLNGTNIALGMSRLLSGPSYDVGYADWTPALQALAGASSTIQLNGTLGPPDWNRLNGTRESEGSVWCIDQSQVFHADVLRYSLTGDDATQATLTGTYPAACNPTF
jgi:hypothetical protein